MCANVFNFWKGEVVNYRATLDTPQHFTRIQWILHVFFSVWRKNLFTKMSQHIEFYFHALFLIFLYLASFTIVQKHIFFFSTSSYCRWVSCSHSSPSGVLHFSNNNRLDSTANIKDKFTGLGEGREWEKNSGQLILYAKNIMTNQYGITLNYHTFLAFHVKLRWMNIWNRFV